MFYIIMKLYYRERPIFIPRNFVKKWLKLARVRMNSIFLNKNFQPITMRCIRFHPGVALCIFLNKKCFCFSASQTLCSQSGRKKGWYCRYFLATAIWLLLLFSCCCYLLANVTCLLLLLACYCYLPAATICLVLLFIWCCYLFAGAIYLLSFIDCCY